MIKAIFLLLPVYLFGQTDTTCITNGNFGKLIVKKESRYSIYVSGEYHGHKRNSEIQLELMRQLYLQDSVRIMLIELGYSKGLILNDYLKNGNKNWIKYIWLFNNNNAYYEKLKLFYDALPANDKFKIIGVDYEGDGTSFFPALKTLLPTNEQKSELKSIKMIDSVLSFYDETYGKELGIQMTWKEKIQKYLNALNEDIKVNNSLMEAYWLGNYAALKKLLHGFEVSYLYDKNDSWDIREEYIYTNINEISAEYPGKKIYGQFGRAHINLTKQKKWELHKNWESFTTKLNTNNESRFNNKTCSIFIYYPKALIGKSIHPIDKQKLKDLKKSMGKEKLMLFDLNCLDSAYYKNTIYELFQYLLISKN